MSELHESLAHLAELRSAGVQVADEVDSKALLRALGVQIPPFFVIRDPAEAARAARRIGLPVAVKAIRRNCPHKNASGSVAGPLRSEREVEAAAGTMFARGETSLLVEHWQEDGIECFLGLALDTRFGGVASFGLGGTWVEVLRDVAHRLAPVSEAEAAGMVGAIRAASLLDKSGDGNTQHSAVAPTIAKLSALAAEPRARHALAVLEVNPLWIGAEGNVVALDAKAFLRADASHGMPRRGAGGRKNERMTPLPDPSRLLEPESVAVVGASSSENKPGHVLLRNIIDGGYEGKLYPVNPKAEKIAGLPAYSSLRDVPHDVDLAFIVLPRKAVYGALSECADAGVAAVCIITAGFGEGDEWGREEENRIKSLVRERGMIAIGPNTIGLVTMGGRMRGSFVKFPSWTNGSVAIIAQTGIFAGAVARELMDQRVQGLGIAASVDIGNRVGLSELDLLTEFGRREEVQVIGCYLEEFTDGREFLARAAGIKTNKPVVVLKPGRTPEGSRASASHTGALSEEGAMLDDLLAQHGVARASDAEEFLSFLRVFSMCPVAGRRVGLVTYSGALGVIATDQAVEAGLSAPPLRATTRRELAAVMPGWQVPNNPVDLWSAAEVDPKEAARKGFGVVLGDPNVDQLLGIVLAVPTADFDGVRPMFAEMRSRFPQKPLHLVIKGPLAERWTTEVEGLGIPVYPSTREAVRAMAVLATYGERRADIPLVHSVALK